MHEMLWMGEYNFYTAYIKKHMENKTYKYRNSASKYKQAVILFRKVKTFTLYLKSLH